MERRIITRRTFILSGAATGLAISSRPRAGLTDEADQEATIVLQPSKLGKVYDKPLRVIKLGPAYLSWREPEVAYFTWDAIHKGDCDLASASLLLSKNNATFS